MLTDILVYFSHAAVVVFGALTVLWAISVAVKDASLIDIFWGFGFLLVASVCLYLAPVKTPYLILLAALPIIWGMRLTLYLGKRNLGHGEDKRYVSMQKRASKKGMSEMSWRLRSLFTIYFGQGLIMIVSAPVWVAMATGWLFPDAIIAYDEAAANGQINAERFQEIQYGLREPLPIGILALMGTILWLIGFLFEAIGDAQLAKFIKQNKDYDGPIDDKPVLDTSRRSQVAICLSAIWAAGRIIKTISQGRAGLFRGCQNNSDGENWFTKKPGHDPGSQKMFV